MTQEQKDKIARIEEMLAKLKEEMEDSKPDELTRETGKPVFEDTYYWIDNEGLLNVSEAELITDFGVYNSFTSYDQAKTEAAYTLASRRVRAFAKAVNGGWKADFMDEQKAKWGIVYNPKGMYLDVYCMDNPFIHQISFPTEELAAKALELFKDEWQILANP